MDQLALIDQEPTASAEPGGGVIGEFFHKGLQISLFTPSSGLSGPVPESCARAAVQS